MTRTQLLSIQVGLPRSFTSEPIDGPATALWTTAFQKLPVIGPVLIEKLNIAGDRQASPTHGGVDKAICVYPVEHYSYWKSELDLPDLAYGSFGENLTLEGQTEEQACIGDSIALGEAVLQISQPRPPCWRLSRWWQRKDFAARMEQTGLTGWYCRIIEEGHVEAGVEVRLLDRPHPQWTIAAANELLYRNNCDFDRMSDLATCEALAPSWRDLLTKRLAKLTQPT